MKHLLKLSSLALFLIFINILMISPLSLFGQNESRHTDTIETTVCVKTFPYKYMDVILSQPGEQYVIVRDKSLTDSSTHHLHVFVCSIDTITMGDASIISLYHTIHCIFREKSIRKSVMKTTATDVRFITSLT